MASNTTLPPLRWTKPGFCDKIFHPGKNKEYFYFDKLPDPLAPLTLNVGDVHLRWVDGYWVNLGSDYQAAITELTEEQENEMIKENQDLYARIEILLDMNTNYELKKAHLREKLADLERQIRKFPGLDLDDDTF